MAAKRIRIVHVNRDPFDIYIGRACRGHNQSKWHNPFKVGKNHTYTLADVLFAYYDYVVNKSELLEVIEDGKLAGKTLACWCAPLGGITTNDPLICHGQILAMLTERMCNGKEKSKSS